MVRNLSCLRLDVTDVNSIKGAIKDTLKQFGAIDAIVGGTEGQGEDFSQILKNTLDQVSQAQQTAQKMTEDFASGENGVNLSDVMINLQKANLSFQEMVQVRNRLVSAYHDIMNMQV